ncbi:MAG: hypothetical protein ACRCZ2_02965, partial [Fusobacteriaceae bacterium]
ENLKAELKALREEVKRELEESEEEKQELAEKLETITALKDDNADYLIVLESEISKLSKELNNRPVVEKEIEKVVTVEKLVEREVVPSDYVLIKSDIEKYKSETDRRNKELADLKTKLEKVKEDSKWKVKELEFKLTAQDNDGLQLSNDLTLLFGAIQKVNSRVARFDKLTDNDKKHFIKSTERNIKLLQDILTEIKTDNEGDYIEIQ